MNTALASARQPAELVEFRQQIYDRNREWADALPATIKPEYFQRAAVTAAQHNPKLLMVERRSLINALMKCAQDGLIPDGREAALVIFKSRERGEVAQYIKMVGGVRKLVQQGGEIGRFEQFVVYEGDRFEYALGDDAHIHHVPALRDRGRPIAVYSIAEFRDGSGRSREVMTIDDVEKVRRSSRSANDGPWVTWYEEMMRKTVAKRHAKVLPTSTDAAAALNRADDLEGGPRLMPAPPAPRSPLAAQFDRLAQLPTPDDDAPRKRGRPRTRPTPIDDDAEAGPGGDDDGHSTGSDEAAGDAGTHEPPLADEAGVPPLDDESQVSGQDGPAIDLDDPDVKRGIDDARAGRMACLDQEIRKDEARYANWRLGYYHAHKPGQARQQG